MGWTQLISINNQWVDRCQKQSVAITPVLSRKKLELHGTSPTTWAMDPENQPAGRLPFLDDGIHVPGHKISIQKWVVLAALWHHFQGPGCQCGHATRIRWSHSGKQQLLLTSFFIDSRATKVCSINRRTWNHRCHAWVKNLMSWHSDLLKPTSSWEELKFWLLRGHDHSDYKPYFIVSSCGHMCCGWTFSTMDSGDTWPAWPFLHPFHSFHQPCLWGIQGQLLN